MTDAISFNRDYKYDLQLSQALIDERRLADFFANANLHKVELKSESYLWEKTGNIAIEYACDGKPSGLASCEATAWIQELKARDGRHLCYIVFDVERLKELCRAHYRLGHRYNNGGDGGRFSGVLIPLIDLLVG